MNTTKVNIYKVEFEADLRPLDYDGVIRSKETQYLTTDRHVSEHLYKVYNPERVKIFPDTIKVTKIYSNVYMQDDGSRGKMNLYRCVEFDNTQSHAVTDINQYRAKKTLCYILANNNNQHPIFRQLHPEYDGKCNTRINRVLLDVVVA